MLYFICLLIIIFIILHHNQKPIIMRYQIFKDSVLVKVVKGSTDKLLFKLLELEKENPNSKIRFVKCL